MLRQHNRVNGPIGVNLSQHESRPGQINLGQVNPMLKVTLLDVTVCAKGFYVSCSFLAATMHALTHKLVMGQGDLHSRPVGNAKRKRAYTGSSVVREPCLRLGHPCTGGHSVVWSHRIPPEGIACLPSVASPFAIDFAFPLLRHSTFRHKRTDNTHAGCRDKQALPMIRRGRLGPRTF